MKSKSSIHLGILIIMFILLSVPFSGSGQTLKIMALGNSLTAGESGDPDPLPSDQMIGYRYGLKYLLQQGGYSVDFVGSQSDGSAFFSDCQHAGIPGTRDQYLERLLIDGYDARNNVQILNPPRPYLDEYNPDIILLHIGTNDITHEEDPMDVERVSAILNLVDQYENRSGKEVIVFLAQIINRREPCYAGSGCGTTSQWNIYLENMAQSRIAGGDKIVIVDMENDAGIIYTNEDFTAEDPQGLHLNSSGYGKMAALWYNKIISNINTAPTLSPIPDQYKAEDQSFDVISLDDYVYDLEDPDYDLSWTATHLTTNNLNVVIDQNRMATVTCIDPGWAGEESIVFTVTDQGAGGNFQRSASDTVVFGMSAENDLPIVTGQSELIVNEDESIGLQLSDFSYHDPDPDQSPEDFSLNVLSGDHYSVTGRIVHLEENYDTDLIVNVSVSDHMGAGPVYQAYIQVNAVNDPPVYTGQSEINFNEDASYPVNISMLEVSDADHDNLELQIVMKPGINHSIEDQVIIPEPNFNGTLYIETFIKDPEDSQSSIFFLEVYVKPVNDRPEFTTEPEDTIHVNQSYIYPFNVEDMDGDDIDYTIVSKPDWITYYPNSRLLAGIPEESDVGYTQIRIRATDGYYQVDQSYYLHVIQSNSNGEPISELDVLGVYPNPSSDIFTVSNKDWSDRGHFKLFDHLGKLVDERYIAPNSEVVLSAQQLNLSPGVYLYSIQVGKQNYSGKLIIHDHY